MSSEVSSIIVNLTRETANLQVGRLLELVRMIPEVEYVEEDILRDVKPNGTQMHEKWHHSYIVKSDEKIVGVLIAYRKETDGTNNYPDDSMYISEIAVDKTVQGQGLAKKLMNKYLKDCLEAEDAAGLPFTLQTNAAEWNINVRRFYEKFGFVVDGEKKYSNRTDVIMRASQDQVRVVLYENNSN